MRFDHSYAKKLAALGTPVSPTPMVNPKLQVVNQELVKDLGLPSALFTDKAFFEALYSDKGALNQQSIAQKYGGHQFGIWNPELGDGRGLLLAEIKTHSGERWDMHLKGAGKTPYSRFGDGRAVLRSTIREYLASEALNYLGIPTSRALCLITSEEKVYREKQEFGAMMIRVCQSHLRFGHFEYYFHTQQKDKLNQLFNYCLNVHFPQCLTAEKPHQALLEEVVISTAELIAKWQAFGFCHGVMNTDNMSMHGITFDFGPYAFLDSYQPGYICNHSDHSGRYAFDQQPGVALWNLNALAHSFTPYLSVDEIKLTLGLYEPRLQHEYARLMRQKLGLVDEMSNDMQLVNDFLNLMQKDKRDFTQSFRMLCEFDQDISLIVDHFIDRENATKWALDYQHRLIQENSVTSERQDSMYAINPKFILRNYLAQLAIDRAEEGDFTEFNQLLHVLEAPFDEQPEHQRFAKLPPDWGHNMEISCSS